MKQQQQHCIIALDTVSYDDERGLCHSATESMSADEIRRGGHLATAETRSRFKATVKRFRHTFTPEFVESSLADTKEGLRVEVVSDIRSPVEIRGRNRRISFVVFAYLDAQSSDDADERTDLVYFSSSALKLLAQRAKSVNADSSRVFVLVLIPGEHRGASRERFKQLEFEADGQTSRFPGIDAASSILSVFVDAKQHMAVESRRRLAFALTGHAHLFVEDSSAHQSLATLRKLVEVGVSDYAVDSRKRTVDDEPKLLSDWSTFLLASKEQVDEDKKLDLLALVRDFVTGKDATVELPSANALDEEDDPIGDDLARWQDNDDDDAFFNRWS